MITAHAGHLVDTDTGEIVRALITDRTCRTCGQVIERNGRTGRQPARCADCQATQRRAVDAARKRQLRAAGDSIRASTPGEACGSLLDGRSLSHRPGRRSRFDDVMDALGVTAGDVPPLVIDRYISETTGAPRQATPYGWHTNAGPAEGSTVSPASDTYALIYGRNGLAAQATGDWWFAEHPAWRPDVDADPVVIDSRPQERQVETEAA